MLHYCIRMRAPQGADIVGGGAPRQRGLRRHPDHLRPALSSIWGPDFRLHRVALHRVGMQQQPCYHLLRSSLQPRGLIAGLQTVFQGQSRFPKARATWSYFLFRRGVLPLYFEMTCSSASPRTNASFWLGDSIMTLCRI